jgi:hypothetical protein
MRRHLELYSRHQVFLNYPFDDGFAQLEDALHFPVIAANMLPLCARDLTVPDRPRLELLVHAISNCHYSLHELSRSTGQGEGNLARMNMPLEMGMAMFHALHTQRQQHRCAFFVPTPHDFSRFASDLAGLDPKVHNNDEDVLVGSVYEWLRDVVPTTVFNSQPTVDVVARYHSYRDQLRKINGSNNGFPSHDERRELMYCVCEEDAWWDWRANKAGQEEFPSIPLSWKPKRKSKP